MRNHVQPGITVSLTAPAGGVTSGGVYQVGDLIGIAAASAAAGDPFEMQLQGVFDVPKFGTALTEGAKVYWDVADGEVNTTASGNVKFGVTVAAATAGDATARVLLDGIPSSR